MKNNNEIKLLFCSVGFMLSAVVYSFAVGNEMRAVMLAILSLTSAVLAASERHFE